MNPHTPGPLARRLLRAPALLYDHQAGWLLGHRFVRLTHTGRRTGRAHQTMLEVLGTRPHGQVVVIAGLGRSADWYRNVQAHPQVEVALAGRRFPATAHTLDEAAAVAVLGDYERRNRWLTPVVHAVVGWLIGWRYDGGPHARWRLVRECPVVALTPTRPG